MNIIVSPPRPALRFSDIVFANRAPRLHHRFVAQAARTPDVVAVLHAGRSTSYGALDQHANRIAHLLRDRGVAPGARVGICLERSTDLVAVVLAVLKIGATYVPLDPSYPRPRLEQMLADSDPQLLVGEPGGTDFGRAQLILAGNTALDSAPSTPPSPADDASSALACIFYTSGSTGRPKGVMLGHDATRFIDWSEQTLGRRALARVAATTSLCFDPSIFEIFATLSLGGTVILKRDLLEPFTAEEQPTLLNGVPSAFAELARENRIPDSVRVINVGGERLSCALAQLIQDSAAPGVQLWNHYGPTETTICASAALVPAGIDTDPPIGHPIAGAVFYVLDANGRPVVPGTSGELHIGGPNVARGYLNRPALTAERFLCDPLLPGKRMYRTGDIVRATAEGALVFLGREGRQIKLRGFRIELDDIEAALSRLAGIDAAATVATRGPDGLVDGIRAVIASKDHWTLASLRRMLRDSLPRHMLPNQLVVLRSLPLNPSGKIDRPALERLEVSAPAPLLLEDPYMPPLAEAVLTVFRDVLKQPALGGQDDFFDAGGDSLLAMDALLRIESLVGEPMPVGLMAGEASAAALAGLVSRRLALLAVQQDGPRSIALQPDGLAAPLFCLADNATRPLQALALAIALRDDRPVWSLAPSRSGSACDHLPHLLARPASETLHLLAAGETAAAALQLAAELVDAERNVVLVLVSPVLNSHDAPDARRGWRMLWDKALSSIGQQRRPLCRTILVSAGRPCEQICARRIPDSVIDQISLPANGDLLRAPAVGLLAEVLRAQLDSSTSLPAPVIAASQTGSSGLVGDHP